MSKLSAIRKQIAALEVEAARIAKEETASAIGKVKALMAEFGLTIEHLTQSAGKASAKKSKPALKKAGAKKATSAGKSPAKYLDPKSGKTWSGFGRAPNWIANAKNREAFLVNQRATPVSTAEPVATKKRAPIKRAAKAAVAPVKRATKTAAKKAAPVARKAAASAKKAPVAAPSAGRKKPSKKAASARSSAQKSAAVNSASAPASSTPVVE